MNGRACPLCEGRGDVRVKGRPGGERVPCPECNGTGAEYPGPKQRDR